MDRAKLALQILAIDIRNARSRQRVRLKRGDLQSLAIANTLTDVSSALKRMRLLISRIEKFETKERAYRGLEKTPRSLTGQNMRLTGTVGKR